MIPSTNSNELNGAMERKKRNTFVYKNKLKIQKIYKNMNKTHKQIEKKQNNLSLPERENTLLDLRSMIGDRKVFYITRDFATEKKEGCRITDFKLRNQNNSIIPLCNAESEPGYTCTVSRLRTSKKFGHSQLGHPK